MQHVKDEEQPQQHSNEAFHLASDDMSGLEGVTNLQAK
jgi:hypothetical protein